MTNHTDRMMLLLVQLLLANLVKCEQLYTGLDLASNSSGIHSVYNNHAQDCGWFYVARLCHLSQLKPIQQSWQVPGPS